MSKVRVCFLGTPDFALTNLKSVFEDEHFEIVGVITQPDRPSGRKLQLTPSPVKVFCQQNGLKVISPEKIKDPGVLDEIKSWGAEVAIVVAYGQILPQDFLDLFNFGAVNVHGSLLPEWRGAAPIQRALEAGDAISGVTLQKVVKQLDAGDIIGIRRVQLTLETNAQQLYQELAILGAETLKTDLMDYIRGNLNPYPQDSTKVTYAKKIEKTESLMDWNQSSTTLHNKVRAFVMGPGTYTFLNDKKLKIHKTNISSKTASVKSNKPAGTIVDIQANSLLVACGEGLLEILEVQPESRTRMNITDFLKGNSLKVGDYFGTHS